MQSTRTLAHVARIFTRERAMQALGVLCNFLLPWALYRLSQPHVGETRAILISAGAPMLWGLARFARNRQFDVWSALVLGGLALGLVALALGGSPRLLLFRESLITGLVGLIFIASALIRRPLFYAVITSSFRPSPRSQTATNHAIPDGAIARALAEFQSYSGKPWFQRVMTVATVAVGLVFVAETATASVLIFLLPTDKVLLIAPFVRYAAAGLLLLFTFTYFVPAIHRGRELEGEATAS